MFRPLLCSIALLWTTSFSDAVQYDDWQPVLHQDLYDHHQEVKSIKTLHLPSHTNVVNHGYPQQSLHAAGEQCEIYKVGFMQDLYFQYIQYKTHIPEMKEFTLCFWSKFHNHSNDHPIFSYAVDGQPKAILAWISNTERSSYFSLSVEGHTFFRLNYPLRLNKWYHTCESWNGKTGEWQIWVNAERVGRGFHNRLVGHVVPSGGLAITGQQQEQLGGGFQEGREAPKGSGGMLGEITMVQLYSVALTAGKAHKDHKHHHAHQYDHNGNQITTPVPPTPAPRVNQPTHPLLTAGQINPQLRLNFAGAQPGQPQPQLQPQIIPGQNFNAQFVNGQFVGSLVSQQLARGRQIQQGQPRPSQAIQFFPQNPSIGPGFGENAGGILMVGGGGFGGAGVGGGQGIPRGTPILLPSGLVHSSLVNPANVQFIDTQLDTHELFKRQNKGEKSVGEAEDIAVASEEEGEKQFGERIVPKKEKRETKESGESEPSKPANERTPKKRDLLLGGGTIFDDSFSTKDSLSSSISSILSSPVSHTLSSPGASLGSGYSTGSVSSPLEQDILDGLALIGQNEPIIEQQKQNDEREPAEAEVMAVMRVCSGCSPEPFAKALVFGWRTVAKKLYSGAFYTPAVPECRVF